MHTYELLVDEFHNTSKRSSGKNSLEMIVQHYSASSSFASTVAGLSVGPRSVSAQFVIDNDGKIAQIGNIDDILWHVGKSKFGDKTSLNKHAIGIEMINPGILSRLNDRTFQTYWGKSYDVERDNLVIVGNEAFLPYRPVQLRRNFELCSALIHDFDSIKHVVGHEAVATPEGRKVDPGDGRIMPNEFYKKLYNLIGETRIDDIDDVETTDEVTVNVRNNGNLNLRSEPGTHGKIIMTARHGEVLKTTGRTSGSWTEIATNRGGVNSTAWGHSSYLNRV